MSITKDVLNEEKVQLQKDFDELQRNIKKVELDLAQMRANLNALNGAMQQTNKLIALDSNSKGTNSLTSKLLFFIEFNRRLFLKYLGIRLINVR